MRYQSTTLGNDYVFNTLSKDNSDNCRLRNEGNVNFTS